MSVISGGRVNPLTQAFGNIARRVAGWVTIGDSATTFVGLDRSGGGLKLEDATDNDCNVYGYGEGEGFKFALGCRGSLKWKQKYTSPTDGGNMFVGFTDTAGATFIADGDTLVSGDHIGMAMLTAADASRAWLPVAQNAGTNSGTATSAISGTISTGVESSFRIEWEGLTAGLTIRFYIDEVLQQTVTGFTYTSFGPELSLIICTSPKGSSTNTLEIYEMFVSHTAIS